MDLSNMDSSDLLRELQKLRCTQEELEHVSRFGQDRTEEQVLWYEMDRIFEFLSKVITSIVQQSQPSRQPDNGSPHPRSPSISSHSTCLTTSPTSRPPITSSPRTCRSCHTQYSSDNELFRHLRDGCPSRRGKKPESRNDSSQSGNQNGHSKDGSLNGNENLDDAYTLDRSESEFIKPDGSVESGVRVAPDEPGRNLEESLESLGHHIDNICSQLEHSFTTISDKIDRLQKSMDDRFVAMETRLLAALEEKEPFSFPIGTTPSEHINNSLG